MTKQFATDVRTFRSAQCEAVSINIICRYCILTRKNRSVNTKFNCHIFSSKVHEQISYKVYKECSFDLNYAIIDVVRATPHQLLRC